MIKPLGDRVLVRKLETEKQIGEIHLADQSIKEKMEAVVIELGQQMKDGPDYYFTVLPGDHVVLNQWSGTPVSFKGVTYIIVKEVDILAILPPDDYDGVDGI